MSTYTPAQGVYKTNHAYIVQEYNHNIIFTIKVYCIPVVLNSRNYKDLCFSPHFSPHKKKEKEPTSWHVEHIQLRWFPDCVECRFVVGMPR